MANRGPTLDPNVLTISDLKDVASKKLPVMFRGEIGASAC